MASSNSDQFGNFSGKSHSSGAARLTPRGAVPGQVEDLRTTQSRKDLGGLRGQIERLQVQRLSEEGILPGGKSIPAFLPRVEPLKPVDIEW
jgi:hypothetical protein